MANHLFSTGTLTLTWSGETYTLYGSGMTATTGSGVSSPGNLVDGNPATTAEFTDTIGVTNYAVVDLGSIQPVTQVEVLAVSVNGGPTGMVLSVYAANASTDTPGGSGTTQIGSTQNCDAGGNFTFAEADGSVAQTRYLLIAIFDGSTGNASTTIGDLKVSIAKNYLAGSLPFATLQDVSFEAAYTRKDLMDASQNAIYAVDTADSEGKFTIKAQSAALSASALQVWTAAQISTATLTGDVQATLATILDNAVPGYVAATLSLQDTDGKAIQITANACKAKGVSIPCKLEDFTIPDFELDCYPDANGDVAIIGVQN